MIRIGAIVLHSSDTSRSGEFWSEALGYTRGPNPEFLVPAEPEGGRPHLHLDSDDRSHLDLWTDSAQEQAAEVERLVGLGATRVEWDYPDDADFVVLAHPDGTLFCIIDTSA